jgi:hypothetical protein
VNSTLNPAMRPRLHILNALLNLILSWCRDIDSTLRLTDYISIAKAALAAVTRMRLYIATATQHIRLTGAAVNTCPAMLRLSFSITMNASIEELARA